MIKDPTQRRSGMQEAQCFAETKPKIVIEQRASADIATALFTQPIRMAPEFEAARTGGATPRS